MDWGEDNEDQLYFSFLLYYILYVVIKKYYLCDGKKAKFINMKSIKTY